VKAMLFAAGLGTRLRPLTDTLPKCLVPVNDRPMIDYPLMLLRHYGIREIVVNVHHHADRVEEYLGDGSRFGVDIAYSREPVLLDTGGGLLGAKRFLDQDTFVIVNSDVLIDLRLDEVLRFHRGHEAVATLVLRKDPMADAYGAIWTDVEGTIRKLLQHEALEDGTGTLEEYMFTGVHVVEPLIFRYMEGPAPFSITRTTYPRMLAGGERLCGFPFDGEWQDLGTPERLQATSLKLLEGNLKPHFL
jgi:mannose-1-phosphate guanylyltransferase